MALRSYYISSVGHHLAFMSIQFTAVVTNQSEFSVELNLSC